MKKASSYLVFTTIKKKKIQFSKVRDIYLPNPCEVPN